MTAPAGNGEPLGPLPAGESGDGLVRVNLLPAKVRLELARRHRRRGWSLVALTVLAVGALGWQWSSRYADEARTLRVALGDARTRVRQKMKKRGSISARVEALRNQLRTIEAMSTDTSWAQNLAALARAVPQGALVTRLGVSPARPARAASAVGRSKTAGSDPDPLEEIVVEGYAADHLVLAHYLRELQSSGLFRQVRLLRSASEPLGTGTALKFGVSCRR